MNARYFLLALLCLALVGGVTATTTTNTFVAQTDSFTTADSFGINVTFTDPILVNITKQTAMTATTCYVYGGGNLTLITTGSFTGNNCNVNLPVTSDNTTGYILLAGSGGSSYTSRYNEPQETYPLVRTTATARNYEKRSTAGVWSHLYGTQYTYNILGVTTSDGVPEEPTITASLLNNVTGDSLGSVLFSNVTGDLTFDYYDITDSGFCVSYSGNGTGTNCTAGSGASTFYNVSVEETITGTQTVTANTYQALLDLSALQLFTEDSIQSFNVTNDQVTNTTSSGSLLLKALTGDNNVMVAVLGNYSRNVTCNVPTALSTVQCNATGIYDNQFTIGASYQGQSVSNFTVTVQNTSLSLDNAVATTNGSIVFSLLRGYEYLFLYESVLSANENITLPANASTNLYNFTSQLRNTIDMMFLDEITGDPVNETVTLTVITDTSATIYEVTNNSGFNISLLSPDNYILRYLSPSYTERDYYLNLQNGSYNTIPLYMITINQSSLIVVTVRDTGDNRLEDATIKLLRYFPSSNSYEIVEMASSSFAGEAGLWAQAVEGFYKWSVDYEGQNRVLTGFENIISNTKTFTINLGADYYESFEAITGMSNTISWNELTGALSYTWSDPSGIVTQGCLTARYANGSQWSNIVNCATGSAGSVILSLDNTTRYQYSATIDTSTTYSSYTQKSGWLDGHVFNLGAGDLGIFLMSGVILLLAGLFSFSAVAVLIVTAAGLLISSWWGLMPFSMNFIVSFAAVVIGLGLYLMRR